MYARTFFEKTVLISESLTLCEALNYIRTQEKNDLIAHASEVEGLNVSYENGDTVKVVGFDGLEVTYRFFDRQYQETVPVFREEFDSGIKNIEIFEL